MKAISDNYGLEQAVVMAINAGADMLIFGNNLSTVPQDPKQLIDIIEAKVASGEISEDRINEAYQHIMVLKQGMWNRRYEGLLGQGPTYFSPWVGVGWALAQHSPRNGDSLIK